MAVLYEKEDGGDGVGDTACFCFFLTPLLPFIKLSHGGNRRKSKRLGMTAGQAKRTTDRHGAGFAKDQTGLFVRLRAKNPVV